MSAIEVRDTGRKAEVLDIDQEMDRFQRAFQQGVQGLQDAGTIYAHAVDANPDLRGKFAERFGGLLSPSLFAQLEAIGRKRLHPLLAVSNTLPGYLRPHLRRMPWAVQDQAMRNERFPLLLANGQTLMVSPLELQPEQCDQLFDLADVRSIPAQRAWLESAATRAQQIPDAKPVPYIIRDGKVTFRHSTVFTKAELKRILGEL